MAKNLSLDDEEDNSPESVDSLMNNDSEDEPSVESLSTKLDPEYEALSNQLQASRPSDDSDVQTDANEAEDKAESPNVPSVADLRSKMDKFTGRTPVQSRMNTADALNMLLGQKNQEISSAQKLQRHLQNMADLQRAGDVIGSAFVPRAEMKPDEEAYRSAMMRSQQPVENIMQRQALQQKAIQDLASKQALQMQMQSDHPDSEKSQLYRNLLKYNAAKAGLKDFQVPDSLSATEAKDLMGVVANEANRHEQAEMRKVISEQNAMAKQGMASQAKEQKQNQALTQTQQMLESARGNPEVQQALKDRYAASKANALIAQNYDPNNMSPSQIHLLASEVGKIATGGVPSVAEMEALTPSTLNTKLAKVAQALTNKPSPANAGAFIKQYQTYLNDLNGNAQNVINDKFGRVIESRKNVIGDDNYDSLKNLYLKSPKQEESKPKSSDSETVQVISPEGQVGTIPKANLEKALQRGFKVQGM
jgi:hypothetical protein